MYYSIHISEVLKIINIELDIHKQLVRLQDYKHILNILYMYYSIHIVKN